MGLMAAVKCGVHSVKIAEPTMLRTILQLYSGASRYKAGLLEMGLPVNSLSSVSSPEACRRVCVEKVHKMQALYSCFPWAPNCINSSQMAGYAPPKQGALMGQVFFYSCPLTEDISKRRLYLHLRAGRRR